MSELNSKAPTNFPHPQVFTVFHTSTIPTNHFTFESETRIIFVFGNNILYHLNQRVYNKKVKVVVVVVEQTQLTLRTKRLHIRTLVLRIPRQRQKVPIRRIRPHHVQIKPLESVPRFHLPHAVMRHLHEQFLRPRTVLRALVLLLARQFPLRVLYPSSPPRESTQPRLLRFHRLPIGSLRPPDRARDLVPQFPRLEGALPRDFQHFLRQHREFRHVQEELLLQCRNPRGATFSPAGPAR